MSLAVFMGRLDFKGRYGFQVLGFRILQQAHVEQLLLTPWCLAAAEVADF